MFCFPRQLSTQTSLIASLSVPRATHPAPSVPDTQHQSGLSLLLSNLPRALLPGVLSKAYFRRCLVSKPSGPRFPVGSRDHLHALQPEKVPAAGLSQGGRGSCRTSASPEPKKPLRGVGGGRTSLASRSAAAAGRNTPGGSSLPAEFSANRDRWARAATSTAVAARSRRAARGS